VTGPVQSTAAAVRTSDSEPGPLALRDAIALVWAATPAGERLKGLPEARFLAELQERFGDRAGRFVSAGQRAGFPLRLRTINSTIALRTAIVGNAAQAMHPIAGQGLNVGLRDARGLARLLAQRRDDPGAAAILEAFRASRSSDAGAAWPSRISSWGPSRTMPRAHKAQNALPRSTCSLPPAAFSPHRMIHGARSPPASAGRRLSGAVGLAFAAAAAAKMVRVSRQPVAPGPSGPLTRVFALSPGAFPRAIGAATDSAVHRRGAANGRA
jgi:hypothetical protein